MNISNDGVKVLLGCYHLFDLGSVVEVFVEIFPAQVAHKEDYLREVKGFCTSEMQDHYAGA